MATRRKVKRGVGGRQGLVRSYNKRRWYEMADWLAEYLVDVAGWAVLALVILLLPVTVLALVLGIHALPLEYLGIPAVSGLAAGSNNFGLTGAILLVEFSLLAAAVRPLFRHEAKGWKLVIAASLVHFADSFLLQHAVSSGLETGLLVYVYYQVRGLLS